MTSKIILSLFFISLSAFANGVLDRAYEHYSLRDYTQDGIKNAGNAAHTYNRVVQTSRNIQGEYARARAQQATHFIVTATDLNRKALTQQGFSEAMQSYLFFDRTYGRNPFKNTSLGEKGKKIYADVLYWSGMITVEWIKDQGGGMSGEWKKVENYMQNVIANGYACLNDGGAYFLLGKRNLLTGNNSAAKDYFKKAYDCAPWNGWNVLHLAQSLQQSGATQEAVRILKEFTSHTPEDLSLEFLPENIKAQKEAVERLRQLGATKRPEAVPGEYVIQLKPQMALFSQHQTQAQRIQTLSRLFQGEVKKLIDHDIVVIRKHDDNDQTTTLRNLMTNDFVQVAEPNYIYRASLVPNDPDFNQTWGMNNQGQLDSKGVKGLKGVDIDVQKAWEITQGSQEIIVGIIDTGVDFSHPELKDNAWVNTAEANGKPGVDDDGNGYIDDINGWDFISNTPLQIDDNGHGTHCAGVIGAKGNDGIGVAGINWKVRIMALKFLADYGGGSLDSAIQAVRYATKMGAKITNNSWGGGGNSEILAQAIKDAGDAGMTFVAAAGNSGENSDVLPQYPAAYPLPNIISVAALTNRGSLANFSNYGVKTVHVAAPGQNILSTVPGNKYEVLSGTSMSAPHVAGLAALVLSHENLSVAGLKSRLINTSAPLSFVKNRVLSGGIINAYSALTQKAPRQDPYDPEKWEHVTQVLSTPHSYSNNFRQEFEIKIPGAKVISAHFSKFNVEENYDRVFFLDRSRKIIGIWSGNHDNEYSALVETDSLLIRLVTDSHLTDYGFDIDKAAYTKKEFE